MIELPRGQIDIGFPTGMKIWESIDQTLKFTKFEPQSAWSYSMIITQYIREEVLQKQNATPLATFILSHLDKWWSQQIVKIRET